MNSIVNKIVKIEKQRLFVAFIDFRKAFDKVNRELLLLKLQRLGIKGLLYENIKQMYHSISYLVKVRGGHLEPIKSSVGLKQGGVLSPLLFNLYIDDIKHIFDDTCDPITLLNDPLSHLLYADDLVLVSTSHNGLNNCLSKLDKFCNTWHLEVNLKKSQVVIFSPSGRLLGGYTFKFQGKSLLIVKSYCYLGIDFASSGSFRIGRLNIMEKARKAMSPLLSIISQFQVPCKKSLKLFHSMIRPIALYNSENLANLTHHQIQSMVENKTSLLAYLNKSDMNTTHQKFLKFILGVKRNCSNMATLVELGEFPLHLHGLISLLSYWHRITQMPDDTLVKQALNFISIDGPSHSEWLATVKFLLTLLNMEDFFLNPACTSTDKFTTLCSNKLKEIFIEQWKTNISGVNTNGRQTNKLRFYQLFKKSFDMEPYLSNINNFQLRKALTKFRCSDHTLEIERGRHKNLKVEDRTCKLCKSGVETELHFLQICPIYESLRTRYFENNEAIDFIDTLQCKDKITAFKVANFIKKASKIRDEILALPNPCLTELS